MNEGITICLKINKYYTNVRQHNLFILLYGYMFGLDNNSVVINFSKSSSK